MSARVWQAKRVLAGPEFAAVARDVPLLLADYSYCLVGGLAVGFHANPPVTVDIDILVCADADGLRNIAYSVTEWRVQPLWFMSRQKGLPRSGVKLIRNVDYSAQVDLIATGKDDFLRSVVEHSRKVNVADKVMFPVCTVEDLIVMKVLVGRDKDMEDVSELYDVCAGLDKGYIERLIDELR